MSGLDEIKAEIREKRAEVVTLQSEGKTKEALKVARELDKLADAFEIESAKAKAKFENFLKHATPVGVTPEADKAHSPFPIWHVTRSGEYRDAFYKAVRANFRNAGSSILVEGQDVKGGYLIPAEMHNDISTALAQENVMRQLGTVITTSAAHRVPIATNRPQAAWTQETGTIALSDVEFSAVTLDAFKLAVAVKISNELLQDSAYNLRDFFVREFVQSIADKEENAFVTGTGTNEPQGFLTALSADTDANITTAAAALLADDVIRLIYSLPRQYRKNAVFVMNDSTVEIVRRLKDEEGRYLWTSSTVAGEPDTLFGYKVYTSAYFPNAVASGNVAVAFGDFSRYVIADRGARAFKPLREIAALEDCSVFLMTQRVDGRLIDRAAIKLLNYK